jgi:hypothetical protein
VSALGRVLETMLRAGPHRERLVMTLTSRYDDRYLTELVDPALGMSAAPLTRPRLRMPWRWNAVPDQAAADSLQRSEALVRLEIEDARRWRYGEFDAEGSEVTSQGSDGHRRWYRDRDGKVRVWEPAEPERFDELPDGYWQPNVSPAAREILDPLLALPALAFQDVEPADTRHGAVVRISGSPRSPDLVESALVSPWAHRCELEVHLETGIVVKATNIRDADWPLVAHEVVELDLDAVHDAARFEL